MNNGDILRIPFRRMPQAIADMFGSPSQPQLRGIVRLYQTEEGVLVTAEVEGLPPGTGRCPPDVFGFHIHESGPCNGTAQEPFADVGSHVNPQNCPHPSHAGDLPPLFSNGGKALMSVLTNRFKVADVIGNAIIIHARPDDFTTQPSGNSGPIIGCGVILQVSR